MTEVAELRNIAIAVLQRSDITVIVDNQLDTAYCVNFNTIYLTTQLIPQELRKYKRVVSRVFDGECAHEAGHIVVTKPVDPMIQAWRKRQNNQEIAQIVIGTLEDKRVNYFILQRYSYDLAYRLQLMIDLVSRIWVDTLKQKIEEQRRTRPDLANRPESYFVDQMLISIACVKGLYGYDVESEFNFTTEQQEFIDQVVEIFDEVQFVKMPMTVVNTLQRLYNLIEQRTNEQPREKPRENTPQQQGGSMRPQSGNVTKRFISGKEKSLKKKEDEAKAEADKQNRQQKETQDGASFGVGKGLDIPAPEPDNERYQISVQRNAQHVERLLNMLKRLAVPKLINTKWVKQGRFMNEILGTAVASSHARTTQYVYAHREIRLEKTEACLGILVDLSGSVNLRDAEDAETTLTETCGRWLRDEDFAILNFGSNYNKIKVFSEEYHTTRARIGGIEDMGGTEMYPPLEALYKLMRAQSNGTRKKILIIVSDFCTDLAEECKKLIKQIEKDDISVIGLGINNTTEQYIRTFCRRARYIHNIRELPEAVFALYREVAL